MGAIKKAFKTITHGIEKAAKGVGDFAKGVATLNLKEAAKGLKEVAQGGAEVARGAVDLTPAGLAANTLLHGALDKVMKKAESLTNTMTGTLIDNFEHGLSNVKDGVIGTVKGIAHGNLGEAMNGIKTAALGAMDVASNFGPGGVAKNLARMAVDTAIGMAAQKTTEAVSKKLDPNGTSVLGGMVADMAGAAVGGVSGASRSGKGLLGDIKNIGRNSADQAAQVAIDTGTEIAANKAHDTVSKSLDPNGTSVLGGMAADMAGTAIGAAGSSGRTGQGFRADVKNAGRNAADQATQVALDTGTEIAANKAHDTVSKTLDPNGTSVLGGMAADMAGTAVGAAGSSGGTGQGFRADVKNAGRNAADQATQVAIDTATEQATIRMANMLDGSDAAKTHSTPHVAGTDMKGTNAQLRQAVSDVAQTSLATLLPIAIDAAIQKTINAMSPAAAQAFANLGQAGGASGTSRSLLDQLAKSIENSAKTAIEQAIAQIAESVLLLAATPAQANSSKLTQQLNQALRNGFDTAANSVAESTTQAIVDIAAKALESASRTAAPQPSLQISLEVGIRA